MSAEGGRVRLAARFLRRRLGGVSTRSWGLLFRLLTSTTRRASTRTSTSDHRVMVIAPHPDDETAGCGGTLIHHRWAGDPVTVVCVTDGTGSTAIQGPPEERAAQRRRELEHAIEILGIDSLHWMALPEGIWEVDQAVAAISALMELVRPSLIYAPSRVDFHPEHRGVARAFALALRETSLDPVVRVYPVLVPLCRPLANLEIDVTDVGVKIGRAIQAHQSQRGSLEPTLRRRRYTAALGRRGGLIEEFWELDATCYSMLHSKLPDEGERFRGLRYDPWTDPLAYLVGRSARTRIQAAARARGD